MEAKRAVKGDSLDGSPPLNDENHLAETAKWLQQAHDLTDGGVCYAHKVARFNGYGSYGLVGILFGKNWLYNHPTMFSLSKIFFNSNPSGRALSMLAWLIGGQIQLPSGVVIGALLVPSPLLEFSTQAR
jgi:hypothetical protein